jgi:hypothetical protein
MAYRVGSATTAGDDASTTRVLTRPIGAVADDILVVLFNIEDLTKTPALTPGSWTKVTAASGEGAGFETHVYISRQGIETGDITITWDGTSIWNSASGAAYDGRYSDGDPLDATSTSNSGTGTTITALGLTTAHDNADVIAIGSNILGTTHGWTGVTERTEFGGQSIADAVQGSAGASGDKTATLGGSSAWVTGLLALRERQAAPTPPAYPDASIWRRQATGRLITTNVISGVGLEFFEAPPAGGGAYTLVVDSATFATTPTAVGLRATRRLAVTLATYATTPTAVGVKVGRKVGVANATFATTPSTVALRATRRLPVTAISYATTPIAVALRAARRLSVGSAAYTTTPSAVNLIYTPISGYTLSVSSASYATTATNVALRATRRLPVTSVAFSTTTAPVRGFLGFAVFPVTGGSAPQPLIIND